MQMPVKMRSKKRRLPMNKILAIAGGVAAAICVLMSAGIISGHQPAWLLPAAVLAVALAVIL